MYWLIARITIFNIFAFSIFLGNCKGDFAYVSTLYDKFMNLTSVQCQMNYWSWVVYIFS
jgi:hypothetical protein